MINDKRKENGLPELAIVIADMVKVSDSEDEKKFSNKMSSTLIRQHLFDKS